jgi:hypothetical protein
MGLRRDSEVVSPQLSRIIEIHRPVRDCELLKYDECEGLKNRCKSVVFG